MLYVVLYSVFCVLPLIDSAPVASDASLYSYMNELTPFDLSQYVSPSGSYTYQITRSPSTGSLTIPNASTSVSIYIPNAGAQGINVDFFTWTATASDGTVSNTATARLSILQTFYPVPTNIVVTGIQGALSVGPIYLTATDPDTPLQNLNYTVISAPTKGSLVAGSCAVTVGKIVSCYGLYFPIYWRPFSSSTGSGVGFDSFKYVAYDQQMFSTIYGTVRIDVTPLTTPPVVPNTTAISAPDRSNTTIAFPATNPIGLDSALIVKVTSKSGILGTSLYLLGYNGTRPYNVGTAIPYTPGCGFCLSYRTPSMASNSEIIVYGAQNSVMVANNIPAISGLMIITIISTNKPPTVPAVTHVTAYQNDCSSTNLNCPLKSCYSMRFDFGVYDDRDSLDRIRFQIVALPSRGILWQQGTFLYVNSTTNGTLQTCSRSINKVVLDQDLQKVQAGVTYAPPLGLSGKNFDVYQWVAIDTLGAVSSRSFVIVDVAPVNQPPYCISTSVTTRQNKDVQIILSGWDPQGESTIPIIAQLPGDGLLFQEDHVTPILNQGTNVTGTLGSVWYSPPPNVWGVDFTSFYFKLMNSGGATSIVPGQIKVTLTQDQVPSPIGFTQTGYENGNMTITFLGIDPDSDPITALVTTLPFAGVLYQCNPINVTKNVCDGGEEIVIIGTAVVVRNNKALYIPRQFGYGSPFDSIEFTVMDDLNRVAKSNARVTIFIELIDLPPIARNVTLIPLPEGQQLGVVLAGFDPNPNATMVGYVESLPTNGTLSQVDGTPITRPHTLITNSFRKVIYTPNTYWNSGPLLQDVDNFTFTLTDFTGLFSNLAYVFVTIYPVNFPPVSSSQTVAVTYGVLTTITLNATDSNQPCDTCSAVINSVPAVGLLYQVTEDGQKFRSIGTGGTVVTNSQRKVMYDSSPTTGSTSESFGYTAVDSAGAVSNVSIITLNVGPKPPSSGGSSTALAAAAAAGGIVGLLCALGAGYYYFKKRKKIEERSLASYLYGRKTSTELLESILLHADMMVVSAMAVQIPITDMDEVGESLCVVFAANGAIMRLLKKLIRDEVAESDSAGSLFRGNSIASKTLKAYSKLIGMTYLKELLSDMCMQVLSNVGAYDVDPRKLKDGANLDENWERLKDASQMFLDAIMDSADRCPVEFREISHFLLTEVETKFPDYKNAIIYVGGFLFLRFIVPAMVAPEGYGVISTVPSKEARQGLINISKGLQNLSNGVQFGNKEAYMMPMNEFIVRNLHGLREFLYRIAQMPDEHAEPSFLEISPIQKEDALSSCHRQLFVNQEAIYEWLADQERDDDSKEKAERPLREFDRMMDELSEADHEEVTEILIAEPPIVRAFCNTIQSAEVSHSILTIFESRKLTVQLMNDLIAAEVSEKAETNPNLLLRGNNTAFKMLKGYMEIIGLDYLNSTLGTMVKFVCNNPEGYDINPAHFPDATAEEMEERVAKLTEVVNEFWVQITGSVHYLPIQIRYLCKQLQAAVEQYFPERRYQVIGEFFFNRLLCPGIVTPVAFGLIDEEPSEEARAVLILISNILLNISHGNATSSKHPWLGQMSHLVLERQDSLQAFIDEIVGVTDEQVKDMKSSYEITPDLLVESVTNVFTKMKEDRVRITALLTPDLRETGNTADRLKAILADLGLPAAKKSRINAAAAAAAEE